MDWVNDGCLSMPATVLIFFAMLDMEFLSASGSLRKSVGASARWLPLKIEVESAVAAWNVKHGYSPFR